MLRSVAVPDHTFLWWDARLQPRLGTIEVRIMDAQSRVADIAALAAFVQCLVRWRADVVRLAATRPEVLAENRFLAARDGMRAEFIDGPGDGSAYDMLTHRLDACHPYAAELDCRRELAHVAALAADPGHDRQRRIAAGLGLDGLVDRLAEEFLRAPRTALAAP